MNDRYTIFLFSKIKSYYKKKKFSRKVKFLHKHMLITLVQVCLSLNHSHHLSQCFSKLSAQGIRGPPSYVLYCVLLYARIQWLVFDGFLISFVESYVSWRHLLGIAFDCFFIHFCVIGWTEPWPQFFWSVESFARLSGGVVVHCLKRVCTIIVLITNFCISFFSFQDGVTLYLFFRWFWLLPASRVSSHFSFSLLLLYSPKH